MFPFILRYGLVAGLIAGVPLLLMTMILGENAPSGAVGMAIGFLIMLIAFSAVFVAVKRRRDHDLGGVIGFWPAFALGLGISVVAALIYVLAWEAAQLLSGSDYAAQYARTMVEDARARGDGPEAVARVTAEAEQFRRMYAQPLYRLPITFVEIFPVGVLVSLVTAGLLRNRRFLPARPTLAAA